MLRYVSTITNSQPNHRSVTGPVIVIVPPKDSGPRLAVSELGSVLVPDSTKTSLCELTKPPTEKLATGGVLEGRFGGLVFGRVGG